MKPREDISYVYGTAWVRVVAVLGTTHYPDFQAPNDCEIEVGISVEVELPPTEYRCLFGGSIYRLTERSAIALEEKYGIQPESPHTLGLCQHELEIGD